MTSEVPPTPDIVAYDCGTRRSHREGCCESQNDREPFPQCARASLTMRRGAPTPTKAIFEDNPRRNSLIFAVHIGIRSGRNQRPFGTCSIARRTFNIRVVSQAMSRASGKCISWLCRFRTGEVHTGRWPEPSRRQDLAEYGCKPQMPVVRLLAPRLHAALRLCASVSVPVSA
jgi:hypothetical protein